jgi:urease accessory protein
VQSPVHLVPSRPAARRDGLVVVTGLAAVVGMALAGSAWAHPGALGHAHADTFLAGLLHPVTGLDHLLAALAVGLWIAASGMRHAGRAGVGFLVLLAIGVLAGEALGTLAGIEPLLALSVVLLGVLLVAAFALPAAVAGPVIGVAGLVHGLAHGSEGAGPGAAWLAGIVAGSLVVMLCGWLAGRVLARSSTTRPGALGWVGSVIAAVGLTLVVL